jgi:type IX secretion system PorP/SprF family membrane protein
MLSLKFTMTPHIKNVAGFLMLLIMLSQNSIAQDPQLSHYYNAPLYMNPAFAGTGNNTRAILNYRNQWPGVGPAYVTFAASMDHHISTINSGVGLMVLSDKQAGFSSTEISPMFSYQVDLNDRWTFRPGLQASFVSRGADYSDYLFGDQLGSEGSLNIPTKDNLVKNAARNNYLDFSTGGILYSDKVWVGLSLHHLNKPDQSIISDQKFPLPVKTSVQAGYKIKLENEYLSQYEKEKSFIPTFMYKSQGKFDQLDLGMYFLYEPIMLGMWYRGIPVKNLEKLPNNESLVFLAGVNYLGLTIGYSYDLTISKLTPSSGGSHEVSLIYEWEVPYRNKKKVVKKLPCPKFNKR